MDVLRSGRRGVSEILAAVLMLALTIVGFALIAPLLVSNTNSQASSIINDIRNDQVQQGESLTLVYEYANLSSKAPTPYLNLGLLNYGSSPVLIKYVFVFTKDQTYDVTDESALMGTSTKAQSAVTCNEQAPNCQIEPQHVSMLQIEPSTVAGAVAALAGQYEVVLYTTDNLAFTFTGSASS